MQITTDTCLASSPKHGVVRAGAGGVVNDFRANSKFGKGSSPAHLFQTNGECLFKWAPHKDKLERNCGRLHRTFSIHRNLEPTLWPESV